MKPGEGKWLMAQSWIPSDSSYDPKSLPRGNILPDMKRRATEYGEGFSFLWQSIPDDTRCWHNRLTTWLPEPWDNQNGTITLIGDSAHSMTFRKSFLSVIAFSEEVR